MECMSIWVYECICMSVWVYVCVYACVAGTGLTKRRQGVDGFYVLESSEGRLQRTEGFQSLFWTLPFQQSVFGVLKIVSCLIPRNTLAQRFLPKTEAVLASQICLILCSLSDTVRHREKEQALKGRPTDQMILLTLVQSSIQTESAAEKSRKAETQKGSNRRIKKDDQEQSCVIRDQG